MLKLALKLGLRYLPKDRVKCRELSSYRLELGVSRSGRLIGGARADLLPDQGGVARPGASNRLRGPAVHDRGRLTAPPYSRPSPPGGSHICSIMLISRS